MGVVAPTGQKKPWGGVQTPLQVGDPGWLLYCPDGHNMQLEAPEVLVDPAGQRQHTCAPGTAEKLPGAQGPEQAADARPVVAPYVPTASKRMARGWVGRRGMRTMPRGGLDCELPLSMMNGTPSSTLYQPRSTLHQPRSTLHPLHPAP